MNHFTPSEATVPQERITLLGVEVKENIEKYGGMRKGQKRTDFTKTKEGD